MGKTFWEKFSPNPFQKLSTHWMSEPHLALRFSFWWLEASVAYVATLCPFSVVRIYVVYSKSIFQSERNDTWVVPYRFHFLMGYALFRGAIRKERPAN